MAAASVRKCATRTGCGSGGVFCMTGCQPSVIRKPAARRRPNQLYEKHTKQHRGVRRSADQRFPLPRPSMRFFQRVIRRIQGLRRPSSALCPAVKALDSPYPGGWILGRHGHHFQDRIHDAPDRYAGLKFGRFSLTPGNIKAEPINARKEKSNGVKDFISGGGFRRRKSANPTGLLVETTRR